MVIQLLDGSLLVEVDYDRDDCEFADNICLTIFESCPTNEKIMIAGETHIFVTPNQARQLASSLLKAAEASRGDSQPDKGSKVGPGGEQSHG